MDSSILEKIFLQRYSSPISMLGSHTYMSHCAGIYDYSHDFENIQFYLHVCTIYLSVAYTCAHIYIYTHIFIYICINSVCVFLHRSFSCSEHSCACLLMHMYKVVSGDISRKRIASLYFLMFNHFERYFGFIL